MANNQITPDLGVSRKQKRDVVFSTILQKRPTLLGLIKKIDTASYATDNVYKWTEYVNAPQSWTVNGVSATASTVLVLDDTTGVEAGMILDFQRPAGSAVNPNGSHTVQARVDVVVDSTTLTITRLGTDEDIEDNSIVGLISQPREEGTSAELMGNALPYTKENYTEIFRNDQTWSDTLRSTAIHALSNRGDNSSPKTWDSFQLEHIVNQLNRQLGKSVLKGIGQARTGALKGRMNGIVTILQSDGAEYDAAITALSIDMINDASSTVASQGGLENMLNVIVVSKEQARKISAFNVAGSNPVVMQGSVTAGDYVQYFNTDLSGTNGGALFQVIVDENMDKDKAILLNTEALSLVPMVGRDWFEKDTTPADLDGVQRALIGEFTLKFQNAKANGIVIKNLTI